MNLEISVPEDITARISDPPSRSARPKERQTAQQTGPLALSRTLFLLRVAGDAAKRRACRHPKPPGCSTAAAPRSASSSRTKPTSISSRRARSRLRTCWARRSPPSTSEWVVLPGCANAPWSNGSSARYRSVVTPPRRRSTTAATCRKLRKQFVAAALYPGTR